MIEFINLKIKQTQSFGYTHKDRMYMHMFIWVNAHTCMRMYVCIMFLKRKDKVLNG
jgi:hypothetical protein